VTFLPIVERELRVRARWRSTFRIRAGGALLAFLFVGVLLVLSEHAFSPGKVGAMMFSVLGGLAFLGCLFEGVRTTADCLSEEKRQGTLGLLFLTDLKGYDVVLGKWMGSSLNSIYCLLAILPPLAVPITLGGVTGGEFWRLVLVLVNTLFFSLSAGMLVSALSYQERRAWLGTSILVGLPALVPWVVPGGLITGTHPWFLPSPTVAFRLLFDSLYSFQPERFWYSLLSLHGWSWLCLGLASVFLPRLWREPPGSGSGGLLGTERWVTEVRMPRATRRQARRKLSLDPNPVVWLVRRMDEPTGCLWGLVCLVCLTGWIWWVGSGFSGPVGGILCVVALGLHLVLALWMATRACHAMSHARDSGMLELLLCTPLTVPQIIQGCQAGLWQGFIRPVIILGAVEFLGLTLQFIVLRYGDTLVVSLGVWFLFFGGVLGVTLFDLKAVSTFGLWMGLATNKASQALARTVLYVLILPWGTILCCSVLWPLVALLKNLVFIRIGNDRLHRRFREIVAGRFLGQQGADGAFLGPPARPRPGKPLPSVLPRGG
jgi:hypothetical protein